jgi:hypothetical protein
MLSAGIPCPGTASSSLTTPLAISVDAVGTPGRFTPAPLKIQEKSDLPDVTV